MGQAQPIDHELSLGEVLSKTFELYQNNFVNFVLLFAVIEAVIGVIGWVASAFFLLPVMGAAPGTFAGFYAFFAAIAVLLLLTFAFSIIFLPVAEGATIKMASEEIVGTKIDLMGAVSFAFSRILSLWAIFIVVGIVVIIGLIALVVPGIILAMMFSLAIPVLLIEKKGVFDSMGRSRQLVAGRWLKTFAIVIVLGIIIVIVSAILGAISAVAGPGGSGVLSAILSALWQPVIPIALTVYYYSNLARTTTPQPGPVPTAPAAPVTVAAPAGMKFCPTCGTQMPSSSMFCPKCGARQPA